LLEASRTSAAPGRGRPPSLPTVAQASDATRGFDVAATAWEVVGWRRTLFDGRTLGASNQRGRRRRSSRRGNGPRPFHAGDGHVRQGGSPERRPSPLLGRPLCSRKPGDGDRSRVRPAAVEAAHAKRESPEQRSPAARAGTFSSRKPFPKGGSPRWGPPKGAKSLAGAVAARTRQPAWRPRVLMRAKQTLPLGGGESLSPEQERPSQRP